MIDRDLAVLYGVETKHLKRQVKRNIERFPDEFMFELLESEYDFSRYQIGTLKQGGNIKYSPMVFTELGVIMLASVLKSQTAVNVSTKISKAFIVMRGFIKDNVQLSLRLDNLERKQLKTDENVERIFHALEGGAAKPRQGIFYDG